jgi:hypothetical protein
MSRLNGETVKKNCLEELNVKIIELDKKERGVVLLVVCLLCY